MYPNTMPWYLQWIDGRVILLGIVIAYCLHKARTSGDDTDDLR